MGTISITTPSDGQTIDASDVTTPLNTIVSEINGSLDSNNIAAGGVVPNNLTSGTGTSWAWQSWTPTWTNLTGGTTNFAKFIQIGKTVHFRLKYTLGSAGVSGSVTFTTPVTMSSDYDGTTAIDGLVTLIDTGTSEYQGVLRWSSSTILEIRIPIASGTYLVKNGGASVLSSTQPHTWASTDTISISGTFEAA